jgi:hypothetical protein
MLHIAEVAWWKTTTPIAKVALQTMMPRISVAVRPMTMPSIADTVYHCGRAADNDTT